MGKGFTKTDYQNGMSYIGKIYNAIYAINNKMTDEWVACKSVGIFRKDLWSFYKKVQNAYRGRNIINREVVALGYSGRLIKALEMLSYGANIDKVLTDYDVPLTDIRWAIGKSKVSYVPNDPPELDLYRDLFSDDNLKLEDLPKDYRDTVAYCLSNIKSKNVLPVLEHYYGIRGSKMSFKELDAVYGKKYGYCITRRNHGLYWLRKNFYTILKVGMAASNMGKPDMIMLRDIFSPCIAQILAKNGMTRLIDLNYMSYADLMYSHDLSSADVEMIFKRLSEIAFVCFSKNIKSYDSLFLEPYTRILVNRVANMKN